MEKKYDQYSHRKNIEKPPAGLRGRELGLWYAKRSMEAEKNSTYDIKIKTSSLNQMTQVLKETRKIDFTCSEEIEQERYTLDEPSDDVIMEELSETGPDNIEKLIFSEKSKLSRDFDFDEAAKSRLIMIKSSSSYRAMLSKRKDLPAYHFKKEIIEVVNSNDVCLISGETGCGKTTQVPQFLLEDAIDSGFGSQTRIVITQPRRISAISVAQRVSQERGVDGSSNVGYSVRLKHNIPSESKSSLLYCTTGILLQWLQKDPLLRNVSHVIVDEVHEREFLCDFLLIMLRRILKERNSMQILNDLPPLRVVLMSATMNSKEISHYFNDCPIVEIPGRLFPVKAYFLEDVLRMTNYIADEKTINKMQGKAFNIRQKAKDSSNKRSMILFDKWIKNINISSEQKNLLNILRQDDSIQIPVELVVQLIHYILNNSDPNDNGAILVFVSGMSEIIELTRQLKLSDPIRFSDGPRASVVICPLHSLISFELQQKAFETPSGGKRKLVIATNIAETSVTIDDVIYVIDCGRIKITQFDPDLNSQLLRPVMVSQANALQRRGRAGRIRSGHCFHLFTSHEFENSLMDRLPPEILRVRLEDIVLRIKLLKLGPVVSFLSEGLSFPSLKAIRHTLNFLKDIQALESRAANLEDKIINSLDQIKKKRPGGRKEFNRETNKLIQEGKNSACRFPDENDDTELTPLGWHLARLPLEPQCAKLLLLGSLFSCLKPALIVAACLGFRSPFESTTATNFGQDARSKANRAKLDFAMGTSSDHIALVTAMQSFEECGSSFHAKRQYCHKNFLNFRCMEDLSKLIKDYGEILYEFRYIGSKNINNEESNRNSYNMNLFRALLCAAFYPNIASLKNGPNNKLTTKSGEKLKFHSSSVNERLLGPADQPLWFTYFDKIRFDDSNISVIFDSTLLLSSSLIFFSGHPQITQVQGRDAITIDGWIKFSMEQKVANLLLDLRKRLNEILEVKSKNPTPVNWSSPEGRILETIVNVLSEENLPPTFLRDELAQRFEISKSANTKKNTPNKRR